MFPENKYRHEPDMKYPSLEPMDLENADPNATLPATRPSSKRSLNEEGTQKVVTEKLSLFFDFSH